VDRSTYDRQRDRLRQELALLEMQEHGAKLAGLDVEGLLEFALLVLRDASRLWSEAGVEQRQKTQCVFFPEGLAFDGE
jgi:hypothetical protein